MILVYYLAISCYTRLPGAMSTIYLSNIISLNINRPFIIPKSLQEGNIRLVPALLTYLTFRK